MGQSANKKRAGSDEAIVRLRNVRTSPRKLNLVAQMIRGQKVQKALYDLEFSTRRISKSVLVSLQSAIANAENNHNMDVDRLYVKEATVGKGLVMKRMRPRAKGRGAPIMKPFSHLTIVVATRLENGNKENA
jgi:large subunit ribosomal protein L22